jgi:hypothetical protein
VREVGTPVARRRAAIAAAAGCLAFAAAPAASAADDALPPDLVTLRPTELEINQGRNHLQLRLANTVANRGVGPLELVPGVPDADPCDENEQPAFQRVFEESTDPDPLDYFDRNEDTGSSEAQVGCMAYHPAHDHFHFQDFARYELRHESSGKLAARSTDAVGKKVSFCVVDTILSLELPGTPEDRYYDASTCFCASTSFCPPENVQGLSIGWADIYSAGTPGQKINIDGLPKGRYCLISTADPATESRPNGRLAELNETNNSKRRRILLHPRKRTLEHLPKPCKLGA